MITVLEPATIDEARQLKQQLEKQIAYLLHDFVFRTKLTVGSINIDPVYAFGDNRPSDYAVEVEAKF